MSETKDTLLEIASDKIAQMFKSEVKAEQEQKKPEIKKQVKLEEATLEDGTKVVIEEDDIFVLVDPEEEGGEPQRVPAPVGEHVLTTGEKVIVTEEGKVNHVMPADEPVEAGKHDEEMDLKKEMNDLKQQLAEIKEMMMPKEEVKAEEEPKEEVKTEVKAEKTELSAEDNKVYHSPEKKSDKKPLHLYSQNRGKDTESIIFNKLFNK